MRIEARIAYVGRVVTREASVGAPCFSRRYVLHPPGHQRNGAPSIGAQGFVRSRGPYGVSVTGRQKGNDPCMIVLIALTILLVATLYANSLEGPER